MAPRGVYIDVMDIEYLKKNIDREWGYRRAEELRVQDLKNRTQEQWLESLPYVHRSILHLGEPNGYLFEEAAELQQVLQAHDIRFCFIGGIPLQLWGEIRQTTDIDLTIVCEPGTEPDILPVLNGYLNPRIEDSREVFLLGSMYLGTTPNGKPVDVSIGSTSYELRLMERGVDHDYGVGVPLHICSAVDLTVLKTVAGRMRDWADLQRIIQRSGETMDWDLVYEELAPLLEMAGRDENLPRLKQMVADEYPS